MVKSKVEISQNFVAFSECMNFANDLSKIVNDELAYFKKIIGYLLESKIQPYAEIHVL